MLCYVPPLATEEPQRVRDRSEPERQSRNVHMLLPIPIAELESFLNRQIRTR